jgi:adenine deaminase
MKNTSRLKKRIDASQGKIPCDLLLKDAQYLDVFSCEWKKADLAVFDGVIVGLESGLKARETRKVSGKWIVPGFIDAHVHVESSMMLPHAFEKAVLARGTTTAICDPHELANVMGTSGIQYFLDAANQMSMDLWVMMSSCVPATHMETNGGGEILAAELLKLSKNPRALGLAEMMNMPGVIHGETSVVEKLDAFQNKILDGHCPLLRGRDLTTYGVAGISSCHESSELEEAREKLTKGISVWIREGSVAKDLKTIVPLLSMATSTSMGFCTDDRNPLDIATEGHIDHLIRSSIKMGISPEVAYRVASWSVARHYQLNQGPAKVGAIAPGYQADLVILSDMRSCEVSDVLKKGTWVEELAVKSKRHPKFSNSIRAEIPEALDLQGPQGRVHVIGVLEGKIITEHRIKNSTDRGVAKLSVLERYGKGSKPANAYVEGFGAEFKGAIASSVGHDSHNLITVGSNTEDMRVALAALARVGGGFCVVQNKKVSAQLALPFGGLMSDQDPKELKKALTSLKAASRDMGCALDEPFLQLAFLSLPVIPSLKLTDRGLVDVNTFKIIDVRC